MNILFYNIPSHIHRVKYKKTVENLYKTVISDVKLRIKKILKTIANVALGLLEKFYNSKTDSKSSTIVKRTLQHQNKYDGRIYVMNEEEYEEYYNGEN